MTQAQSFEWTKQLRTPSGSATVVAADLNKNVISAGYYYDSIFMNPNSTLNYIKSSNTLFSSYLSKLDSNGNYVWGHAYETPGEVRIIDIDVDNQNNIFVAGQFADSLDLDFSPNTQMHYGSIYSLEHNIFLAKYDANGNLIWGKVWTTFGIATSNKLHLKAIKVDPADDIVLFGDFTSAADFNPNQGIYLMNLVNLNANEDQYLLKMSASGNFMWARQWGAQGFWNNSWWSSSNMLDVDQQGNIYFPLMFQDSVDADPELGIDFVNSQGLLDASLMKVSPLGGLIWHKEIGGSGHDYCNALAVDPAGAIFYLFNTSSSPIDMDPGNGQLLLNQGQGWGKVLLKLDNSGTISWAKENLSGWNSGWWDEGIATDIFGDIYIYSKIQSSSQNNLWDLDPGSNAYNVSSSGLTDVAIQNLDGNGDFIWGGVIGGTGQDYCYSICTDQAEGVYLTGYIYQKADLNPFVDTNFLVSTGYSTDPYILKLNNCNKFTQAVYESCDSVLYDNQYYFTDTLIETYYPASTSCDSIFSVKIDVHPSYRDTLVVDTCKFYLWNGVNYVNTGVYSTSQNSIHGCDSVSILDLTIYTGSVQVVNSSACDSASVNGIYYSVTGQYQQQYIDINGCDSNYIINFTKGAVDTSITVSGPTQLTANATSVTYQWIDCSNMQLISGATGAIFNAPQSGSYACILTQNSCVDTSYCYQLTVTPDAIQDYALSSKLYPNPSSGNYQLELDREYKEVQLEIRTMHGQVIWKKNYHNLKETTIKLDRSAGIYMLYIKQGERIQVKKLLKW